MTNSHSKQLLAYYHYRIISREGKVVHSHALCVGLQEACCVSSLPVNSWLEINKLLANLLHMHTNKV